VPEIAPLLSSVMADPAWLYLNGYPRCMDSGSEPNKKT
jgi:hypothetical protein